MDSILSMEECEYIVSVIRTINDNQEKCYSWRTGFGTAIYVYQEKIMKMLKFYLKKNTLDDDDDAEDEEEAYELP